MGRGNSPSPSTTLFSLPAVCVAPIDTSAVLADGHSNSMAMGVGITMGVGVTQTPRTSASLLAVPRTLLAALENLLSEYHLLPQGGISGIHRQRVSSMTSGTTAGSIGLSSAVSSARNSFSLQPSSQPPPLQQEPPHSTATDMLISPQTKRLRESQSLASASFGEEAPRKLPRLESGGSLSRQFANACSTASTATAGKESLLDGTLEDMEVMTDERDSENSQARTNISSRPIKALRASSSGLLARNSLPPTTTTTTTSANLFMETFPAPPPVCLSSKQFYAILQNMEQTVLQSSGLPFPSNPTADLLSSMTHWLEERQQQWTPDLLKQQTLPPAVLVALQANAEQQQDVASDEWEQYFLKTVERIRALLLSQIGQRVVQVVQSRMHLSTLLLHISQCDLVHYQESRMILERALLLLVHVLEFCGYGQVNPLPLDPLLSELRSQFYLPAFTLYLHWSTQHFDRTVSRQSKFRVMQHFETVERLLFGMKMLYRCVDGDGNCRRSDSESPVSRLESFGTWVVSPGTEASSTTTATVSPITEGYYPTPSNVMDLFCQQCIEQGLRVLENAARAGRRMDASASGVSITPSRSGGEMSGGSASARMGSSQALLLWPWITFSTKFIASILETVGILARGKESGEVHFENYIPDANQIRFQQGEERMQKILGILQQSSAMLN